MDSSFQGPNHQNDDVFLDALPHCPFNHCPATADTSPESSAEASILSDLNPPSPTPATTVRRRPTRRHSPARESKKNGSDDSSPTVPGASLWSDRNLETPKENEDSPEKCDSNQKKLRSSPSPSVASEEGNEESTLTSAENDDRATDSADSAVEIGNSPINLLDYVTGLVIRAIVFQINAFFVLVKCPVWLTVHAFMFFIDPFGAIRMGKGLLVDILGRVLCGVCGCIGSSAQGWLKEHKSLWNVAFRCGWGLLWSVYVCCILCALLVCSLVVSGILVKSLVEKPFQMSQGFNFDYTKQSPFALVPVMSCDNVGMGHDSGTNVAVGKRMGRRVIPANQKVEVTVSLVVPESEYNTNLGIFQIKVDFLSFDGKTIWTANQPCMLKFISEPIRLMMTFLKIVPLVTGFVSETQTLNVNLRGFVEGNVPTSCLKVTLEHRAEYPPGAGIPQIYDSSVIIESELPLIKRILWRWKLGIFLWIAMMAFMMELLFVLVCCLPIIIPRTRQGSDSARVTGGN
ncbi:seipin-2-like [Vigna unguiculata]|uniref:Seipin family n=1 Tax=Vigna unguiculata TaxID=3917 RepID=A0A4D6L7N0_VIGUN|nr:seipin-2-like [Vigna unguiculata]QCD84513.1 Seipin family [Vigna unguiculata]